MPKTLQDPARALLVGLTGQSFSRLDAVVASLTRRHGALGASMTLVRGSALSLNGSMRLLSIGVMGVGAGFAGFMVGKAAADTFAAAIENAAQKEQDLANAITKTSASLFNRMGIITDKKGADETLKIIQNEIAKEEAIAKAAGQTPAKLTLPFSTSEQQNEGKSGIEITPLLPNAELLAAQKSLVLLRNLEKQLLDEQTRRERIRKNEAQEAAKAEQARIDALVAKLGELKDLSADLDFRKLSPQGQYAALGMQIDALKGKLASLPAPDPDSRDSVNRHLARQLDLQNQIAQAEAKRALITKQLDADARAAAGKDLAAREQLQQNILAQIDRERELLALRKDITPAQKQEVFNDLLTREKTALEEVVRLKKEELALSDDPLARARVQAEIDALNARIANPGAGAQPAPGKLAAQRQDVAGMDAGSNPGHYNSAGEGVEGALLSQIQQIGTEGDIVANGLSTAFGGAISGIQTGIEGIINRTQTWGQALRNIGSTILSSVVSAIAQMFAQWIAGEIARFAIEKTLGAQRKSEKAGEIAVNTVAAGTQCVAQMGPWGLAAFAVAMVAIMALSAAIAGSFATGGLVRGPGSGTSDEVLARVSNGEFVMPAHIVGHYGLDTMEAIRSGALDLAQGIDAVPSPLARGAAPSQAAGGAGAGGSQEGREVHLHLAFFSTETDARTYLASTEGEGRVIEIVKGRRIDLGFKT
ncbi:MAG: hypothetical protein LBO05_04220 [Deltaproteobacteria bacterium]|jgi:hypothetical protein|nr:hypothetical protein [Deltaproteobacteria bacterium]